MLHNCCICIQATKSEYAFSLRYLLPHLLSVDLQYRGSSASIIILSDKKMWLGWFQMDAGKSKAMWNWRFICLACEVKWNHKSSVPKRPSLFALTSYLVPTEGDEHACLCKDCVACWLTVFTLYWVNVHVVAKVTFACSMLVSFHLKKSHGKCLQPYQQLR